LSTAQIVVHRSRLSAAESDGPRFAWCMKLSKRIAQRLNQVRRVADAGMTTAEYAVGTIAAVAFAAVLYRVVRSDAVQSALSSIVVSALHGF
jgi:Protein of unknown function (DUF4244)